MIRTDGIGTIAHYPAQTEPESCPVLTAPGRVKVIRVRPGVPDEYIEAMRRLHPDATIVIPPEEEAWQQPHAKAA